MSFKQSNSGKYARAAAAAAAAPLNVRATEDPYWGTAGHMDDVPLSSMRSREPEPVSRRVEGGAPELSLFGLCKHHFRDWLIIILCIIVDAILNVIHPFNRFVNQDSFEQGNIKFPHKSDTVPLWSVPFIAIGIPVVVFLAFWVKSRDSRDFHHAVLGLLTAIGVTAVFTDALKNGVGRARPDFFWRCFPTNYEEYGPPPYFEVRCNGDPSTVREGHKSFPSGHAAWASSGLTYLSFYLAGKVTFFDRRGYSWRILFVLSPMLGAAMVAVSRVSDYRHHWQDVTVGGLLGLVIAYVSYKQHFPDFSDQMASRPYPHIHRNKPQPVLPRTNPGEWEPAARPGVPFDVESARM